MSGCVLVIEPEIASMELMFHLLSTYGYVPIRARNCGEGLKLAARARPDLILSEIAMPFVDGYEVARRVRADPTLSGLPMIAVTAFATPADRNKTLAAGFDGYISKPIEPERFARQVAAFLRPGSHAGERAMDPLPPPLPQQPGRQILVVDDTPVNLKLAAAVLRNAGYRVNTAQSMGEALRLARSDPPDLIVSDIVMRDGSGYEFIRAVKNDPLLRAIPFIFNTSSMAVESARAKGLALGAARFLFRPMDPKEMLREIEACLGQPVG